MTFKFYLFLSNIAFIDFVYFCNEWVIDSIQPALNNIPKITEWRSKLYACIISISQSLNVLTFQNSKNKVANSSFSVSWLRLPELQHRKCCGLKMSSQFKYSLVILEYLMMEPSCEYLEYGTMTSATIHVLLEMERGESTTQQNWSKQVSYYIFCQQFMGPLRFTWYHWNKIMRKAYLIYPTIVRLYGTLPCSSLGWDALTTLENMHERRLRMIALMWYIRIWFAYKRSNFRLYVEDNRLHP